MLRGFAKPRNGSTLQARQSGNLPFNFGGMTRRSMPPCFKAPCSLWRAFAVRPLPAAFSLPEGGSWGRSFSADSWGHSLCRRCIERSGKRDPVFGRIMGRGFRMGWVAESATRNSAQKRDAVSPMGLNRKMRPSLRHQNGTHFPRGSIAATEQRASFATRPRLARRVRPAYLPRSRRRRLPALRGRGSPS